MWTHTITGGPWWARRGCRCRVLAPADTPRFPPDRYPWVVLGDDLVVVLVENDPLDARATGGTGTDAVRDGWSCLIRADDLTPIG